MLIDILILGSGPAGLTAALYAARGNATTIVISGPEPGGQLMLTLSIENYPGIITSGSELIDNMIKQCKEVGVRFISDYAIKIEKNTEYIFNDNDKIAKEQTRFIVKTSQAIYYAKSIIIATGSKAKWLDVPNAKQFQGNGISTCATCDGWAFKDKTVAVVGGGNTAVEDAIYLSKVAKEVILIHRRDELRAEKIMQKALFACKNVRFAWNTAVQEVIALDDALTGVCVKNLQNNEKKNILVDGIFVAIGHIPNTDFLRNILTLDDGGYIQTKHTVETDIIGLYAAGDVIAESAYLGKQAIVAAGTGCTAAMQALKLLHHS